MKNLQIVVGFCLLLVFAVAQTRSVVDLGCQKKFLLSTSFVKHFLLS